MIKRKLILSYILCVVVPLVIVNLLSSSQSKMTVKDTTSQLAIEMVKQTSANTSYYTDAIEKTMTRVIVNDLNSAVNNLINDYVIALGKPQNDVNKFEQCNLAKKIVAQFNYSASLDNTIDDIAMVMEDGTKVLSGRNLKESELDSVLSPEPADGIVWHTVTVGEEKKIYVTKQVINMSTGKKAGILVLKANYEVLKEKVNNINLFAGSIVSILDSEGQVICSNTEEIMSEKIRNSINLQAEMESKQIDDTLVASAKSNNGWLVVAQIPQKMLTKRIDQIVNIIWLIIAIIALVAIFIGQRISKSIVDSVNELKNLMKKAEAGDLTVVAAIKGHDEISELGNSFNHMIENIKKLLEEAKNTIEHSLEAASTLKRSTSTSVEGFSQLALSIESIVEGSNSQSEDAQDSVLAMEELSKSIQLVITDTLDLLKYNQGTRQMIEEASANMTFLNTTVSTTHHVSNEMSQSIMELNVLTKAIREIMKFLDDISERTNMLALNATIEAARAGTAGKGFAVVANEVRNLATQSKDSSNHVKEALKDIENKVLSASDLVVRSNQLSKEQEVAVNKTHHSLNQMINGLKEMNERLDHIKTRIELMNKCKGEMSAKIENIAVINEENAAAIEEVNALSEEQHCVIEQFANLANGLLITINRLEKSVATFVVHNK